MHPLLWIHLQGCRVVAWIHVVFVLTLLVFQCYYAATTHAFLIFCKFHSEYSCFYKSISSSNSQPIRLSGILFANRKNPPIGVSFSDFICTFAKSFRVSFVIKCNTKISEISDMAKSLKTFVAQVLIKILYNSVAEIRNMLNIDDIRQLRIVHCMIQKRTTGTPDEFASMLCVSRRKMYYILDKLKGLGAQVVYSRTDCTFYYLKKFDLDISIKIMTKENNEWQEISGGFMIYQEKAPSVQVFCTEGIFSKIFLHSYKILSTFVSP